MKNQIILFVSALCLAPAWAATIETCEDASFGIASIVPQSEKTYYNGKVATYSVDKGDPAASPAGIAIRIPITGVGGDPDVVECKAVAGLGSVEWDKKVSTYDETKGVLISVPATEYNPTTSDFDPVRIKVRINLETGSVTLE